MALVNCSSTCLKLNFLAVRVLLLRYQYYIKLVPFSYGKYAAEGDPVSQQMTFFDGNCNMTHVCMLCALFWQLLSYQYSFTEKFVPVTNDYALTALPGEPLRQFYALVMPLFHSATSLFTDAVS